MKTVKIKWIGDMNQGSAIKEAEVFFANGTLYLHKVYEKPTINEATPPVTSLKSKLLRFYESKTAPFRVVKVPAKHTVADEVFKFLERNVNSNTSLRGFANAFLLSQGDSRRFTENFADVKHTSAILVPLSTSHGYVEGEMTISRGQGDGGFKYDPERDLMKLPTHGYSVIPGGVRAATEEEIKKFINDTPEAALLYPITKNDLIELLKY